MNKNKYQKVAMIGKGAFGSAFGNLLERSGIEVKYWDVSLDEKMEDVIKDTYFVFIAISAQYCREVLEHHRNEMKNEQHMFISLMKGIELSTNSLMTDVVSQTLNIDQKLCAAIAGPNIAKDIISGDKVGLTASHLELKKLFENNTNVAIEIIDNKAIIQLLSCLKNIYAIYSGYLKGQNKGLSERCQMLTDALEEINVFLKSYCQAETLSDAILSYAGIGDFMVTCFSEKSRNFTFGRLIGEGYTYDAAIHNCGGVAEGVATSVAFKNLADKYQVEMPILENVISLVKIKNPVSKSCN